MPKLTEPEPSFADRFVDEVERLGMGISPARRERLRRGSRGQIMVAMENHLSGIPAESLRSLARRGPEELARELARNISPRDGITSVADEAAASVYAIVDLGNIFSGLDL